MTVFLGKPIDQITEADLDSLITLRYEEGPKLDFKTGFPEGSKDEKQKGWIRLNKTICTFANTQGGTILLGVHEKKGIAEKIVGIDVVDWEKLRRDVNLKIDNAFNSSLNGIQFKQVLLENGKSVVILNIPFSLKGPHRVKIKEDQHIFVKRKEASTSEMTVDELRDAFLRRDSWYNSAEQYRSRRIEDVLSQNAGPLAIDQPAFFMHLCPLGNRGREIDFKNSDVLHSFDEMVRKCNDHLKGSLLNQQVNRCFEGVFYKSQFDEFKRHLLIERNGNVEFVTSLIHLENENAISLPYAEKYSLEIISHVLKTLMNQDVSPPYVLFTSIVGVKNRILYNIPQFSRTYPNPLPRHRYDLPGFEVENLSSEQDVSQILSVLKEGYQPFFDFVWNDLNVDLSPNSR